MAVSPALARRQVAIEIGEKTLRVAGVDLAMFCVGATLAIAADALPTLRVDLIAHSATVALKGDAREVVVSLREVADEIEAAMTEPRKKEVA